MIKTNNFDLSVETRGDNNSEILAFVAPGLIESSRHAHIQSHLETLADLGCFAISADMPGTWGSGDDIKDYDMKSSLQAIDEIIDYYGDRLSLFIGHSNGGRLAAISASHSNNAIGLVSIMSAPTFIRASNYYDRAVVWKDRGYKEIERDTPDNPDEKVKFELPYEYCETAKHYDARKILNNLHIPKMFIAGTRDTTVLKEDVYRTYARAAEPKALELVDSDHDYRFNEDALEEVDDIIRGFTRQQLKRFGQIPTSREFSFF